MLGCRKQDAVVQTARLIQRCCTFGGNLFSSRAVAGARSILEKLVLPTRTVNHRKTDKICHTKLGKRALMVTAVV